MGWTATEWTSPMGMGAQWTQRDSVDAETVIAEQGRIALRQAKLKLS